MAINPKNTAAPELFHFEYSDNNELTLSFRGKGTPLANLQLFDDKNKNGVKDADEQRSSIIVVDNQGNWKLDVKVGQLTANSNFAIRSVENNDSNISEITSLTYTQPLPAPPTAPPAPIPGPPPAPVPTPQISITRNVGDIAESNVLALSTFPTTVTYNVSQGTPNGEVQLANSGSAKVGSDLQFTAINLSVLSSDINKQTATIKLDGQGNASFSLTALADDLVEGDETIGISVFDPAKLNGTATAAPLVTVHDLTTPPPPSITRDQSQISEPGIGSSASSVTQVIYTVSGQANTIVNLSNKGSAIVGEDVQFTALSGIWSDGNIAQQTGSVKLNDKGQASFSLTAVADTKIEGDENLLVSVTDGKQTGNSDAVVVRDFVTPLSIISNIRDIFEPTSQTSASNPSQVIYTITGAPNQLVALRNTGVAKIGEDLTSLPVSFEWLNPDLIQQSANIKLNNQGVATFTLVALGDNLIEGDESLKLSVTDAVNSSLNDPGQTVTLHDSTQRPQLQITADQTTITETAGSNSVVQVNYTIKGGTANATVNLTNTGSASIGVDTVETSNSSIKLDAKGEARFNLTAVADKLTEGDENIIITAVDAQDSTNNAAAQTVIIRDTSLSSSQLQITANQQVISEIANANSPNQVKYTITGGTPNAAVTISDAGTASLGVDTTENPSTITLDAKGEASFSLSAVADKITEGDENIVITVADAQNPTNKATAAAVLINDTSRPQLQITADQTAIYELAGTNSPALVNYKITGGNPNATVNLNNNGNAVIGTDTNSLPAIKLDAKGEASFSLTAVADNIAEGNENLIITVSDAQEPLNIVAAPSVVIHDTPALNFNVSKPNIFDEGTGNNPAKVAQLTVELTSPPPSQAVTVFWSTKDGTAIGATGSIGATGATGSVGPIGATGSFDYQATSNGQLTFAPGETSKTINIPLVGDSAIETDENFSVILSNPTANAILGPLSTQTVTIKNDDILPTVRFAASSVAVSELEGNFSVATVNAQPANKATLTVELSTASDQPVSVSYATKDGTATSPAITTELPRDYIAASAIISFAPGEITKTVDIQFETDANFEQDETFSVLLSNLIGNATLGTANNATVTITNDDKPPVASFSQTAISIAEGNSGDTIVQVPISLSAESFQEVTVQYSTSNGTARGTAAASFIDPADYRPVTNGSFTFQPGETTGFINLAVIGDSLIENNENFTITLVGVNNNVGTPNSTVVTINNDDQQIIG